MLERAIRGIDAWTDQPPQVQKSMLGLTSSLARHVQDDEHTLIDSVEMAWGYLQQVFQSGGMDAYLDSVQAHCFALREAYEHDTLAGLVDDLVQIAESDGDVASAEIAYIAAVSGHLGVEVSQPGT